MADHTTDTSAETDLIDRDLVERVLGAALRTGGDFAEVYVEDKRSSSAVLDDGKVEEVTSGRDRGAGIRVVVGDTTGYAHTADLCEAGLLAAAEAAAAAASRVVGAPASWRSPASPCTGSATSPSHPTRSPRRPRSSCCCGPTRPPAAAAVRHRPRPIVQVSAGYGDSRKRILVANCDGLLVDDDQVRTLFRVSVVASGDTGMQTGYESLGHTIGFELFDQHDVEELARRAAERALTKLNARPAPSGELPVVIRRGSGGVLFHEACGHGLEADLVGKGASVFKGRVGEQVAAPLVTLVDDGTMAGEWGAIAIDDEGHPGAAQRPHRGRRAHRLHVGLPPGPQGGPAPVRQRPPPELPAPADGADDQHVRAERQRGPRRHHRGHRPRRATSPSSVAARSTRPRATSCSA